MYKKEQRLLGEMDGEKIGILLSVRRVVSSVDQDTAESITWFSSAKGWHQNKGKKGLTD